MIESAGRHLYMWKPDGTTIHLGPDGDATCDGCGGKIIYDRDSEFNVRVHPWAADIDDTLYEGGCAECSYGVGNAADPILVRFRVVVRK